jgi:starch phosphorylase
VERAVRPLPRPGWSQRVTDKQLLGRHPHHPDHQFWSVHQSLKAQMLHLVRHRVAEQHARNHGSEAHLDRLLKLANPDNPNVLTIGFARRFATYKRAALLFENLDWLREILCDPQASGAVPLRRQGPSGRPAGPGLIRRVIEVARMPEFEGKILVVEGYDLRFARRLVSGVDVWLNNPQYPLEACGTSGMKAAINGIPNLSVLDGWWGEGYDGKNGWASSRPPTRSTRPRRNHEEARTLYEILQDSVIPLYYNWGPMGYSPGWVAMAKHSIATLLPRFNSTRMLSDYLSRFYVPARTSNGAAFAGQLCRRARRGAVEVARARRLAANRLRRLDAPKRRIGFGDSLRFEVAVKLDGLQPGDVVVELLFGRPAGGNQPKKARSHRFRHERQLETANSFTPSN